MPPKPLVPLQLHGGGPFVTPVVAAVSNLEIPGGQSRLHIVLGLLGGASLYIPMEREELETLYDLIGGLLEKGKS